MSISKDTELLAEMLVEVARLLACRYPDDSDLDFSWALTIVDRMRTDIERAKSDE